jgi:hypothetical protein
MSDTTGKGSTSDAVRSSHTGDLNGGLLDVSGLTFAELSDTVGTVAFGRALDYVLASGQNGSGYHGFNSRI